MEINNISNAANAAAVNQASNTNNNSNVSGSNFKDILNDVQSSSDQSSTNSEDASLKTECKKFESIFLKEILDESKMFSNIGNESSDDTDSDSSTSTIGDMLSQSFADKLADEGGIGLADKLYSNIKQRYYTGNKG